MRDWASGGGAKIERAKEHVTEFEVASRAFLKSHLYTAVGQFDAQIGMMRFHVESAPAIPPRLAAITADAIHNLRVPLDVLWHSVWSRGIPGYRKQYFPFCENADELKARFRTIKQPSHKTAVDILRKAKFYKSGHKLIGVFNEIDARDKHEMPLLAAASFKKSVIKFPPDLMFQGKGGLVLESELADGFLFLEHGTELPLQVRVDTDGGPVMDMECDLTADIAFGQGELLEGEPVLKTLHELTQLVEGVTNAFLAAGLIR